MRNTWNEYSSIRPTKEFVSIRPINIRFVLLCTVAYYRSGLEGIWLGPPESCFGPAESWFGPSESWFGPSESRFGPYCYKERQTRTKHQGSSSLTPALWLFLIFLFIRLQSKYNIFKQRKVAPIQLKDLILQFTHPFVETVAHLFKSTRDEIVLLL